MPCAAMDNLLADPTPAALAQVSCQNTASLVQERQAPRGKAGFLVPKHCRLFSKALPFLAVLRQAMLLWAVADGSVPEITLKNGVRPGRAVTWTRKDRAEAQQKNMDCRCATKETACR